jgi:PAS domain S-box-containing protein
LYSNGAMQRLCGRSSSELNELHFKDLLTRAGSIFYETQFIPALRLGGAVQELSFDLIATGGTRVPILATAVLETGSPEALPSALIVLFEATQRRRYEKELLDARRDSEQMAEVVRRSSDGILSLTPDGRVRSWNDGAKQIFGYSSGEAIGQELGFLWPESEEQHLSKAVEKLKNGIDSAWETSGRRKDGSLVSISLSLTAHLEAPGTMVGFSAIIRNTTAMKVAERALIQADKLASVGRLASSIAHELNNPLAAVTNLLYLLNTGAKDQETRSLVITAQSELARVSHIATHTLRFHRQSSRKTEIDLGLLFEDVVSLYKGRFIGAHIETRCDTRNTSLLECYDSELRQVLVNLVSNAFDAMRQGGTLLLRSRNTQIWPLGEPAIRISVMDDGSGLSPEACEHLYEPFFSTKGINGAGLGLWISKDLVIRNGGTMRIRSSSGAESHGTIVSMIFPSRVSDDKDR